MVLTLNQYGIGLHRLAIMVSFLKQSEKLKNGVRAASLQKKRERA